MSARGIKVSVLHMLTMLYTQNVYTHRMWIFPVNNSNVTYLFNFVGSFGGNSPWFISTQFAARGLLFTMADWLPFYNRYKFNCRLTVLTRRFHGSFIINLLSLILYVHWSLQSASRVVDITCSVWVGSLNWNICLPKGCLVTFNREVIVNWETAVFVRVKG